MSETTPIIQVENLRKLYGDFTALKGISFAINKGEIVGFLGPNGAGKTTAMKIITGYIPATEGSVTVDGMNIFSQSLDCRRMIGYLPEDVPLYEDMRVTKYLTYVCQLRDIPKSDIPFKIETIVADCNLEPVKNKLIRQLSKGNRQRVGLAQALIHEPEILILDEPTVGLDPKQVVTIRELITRLRKNHTVILSTHILSEVEQMCDRVIIISEGEICLDRDFASFANTDIQMYDLKVKGPADEVKNCLSAFGQVHEAAQEDDSIICRIELKPDADPQKIARSIIEKDWGLIEMKRHRDSLESLFLEVTMR